MGDGYWELKSGNGDKTLIVKRDTVVNCLEDQYIRRQ